jgi:hypothetical protein
MRRAPSHGRLNLKGPLAGSADRRGLATQAGPGRMPPVIRVMFKFTGMVRAARGVLPPSHCRVRLGARALA